MRLLQVHKEIESNGKYDLTYDELVHGCGMAWRNAPRCVARVQWQSLKVCNTLLNRNKGIFFQILYIQSAVGYITELPFA